jgi:hypothetical protein
MCTRLRGLLFLLPSALAVAVAVADANAALEPAGWGDLDGWAGDDHASAFATFYASCRPIVRMIAFRAEPLVYMEDIGRHNAVGPPAGCSGMASAPATRSSTPPGV